MAPFSFFTGADINAGVQDFRSTPNAILLDVRTREEFASGHIPGAVNLPLQDINRAEEQLPSKESALFVYCLSGGRSAQAASSLKRMGYQNVTNIGGIGSYRGEIER